MTGSDMNRLTQSQSDAFRTWLSEQLDIDEPQIQEGLWQAIVFSTAWLPLDRSVRPTKAASIAKVTALRRALETLNQSLSPKAETDEPAMQDIAALLRSADIMFTHTDGLRAVQEHLQLYATLLDKVEAAIDRRGPGRPKDDVLWDWVSDLSEIWSFLTDRPTRVDYHGNEPITPYARFMHYVVALLDPDRLRSLPNVLRRYRTAQNQR